MVRLITKTAVISIPAPQRLTISAQIVAIAGQINILAVVVFPSVVTHIRELVALVVVRGREQKRLIIVVQQRQSLVLIVAGREVKQQLVPSLVHPVAGREVKQQLVPSLVQHVVGRVNVNRVKVRATR